MLLVMSVKSQRNKFRNIFVMEPFEKEVTVRFNFLGLLDPSDANISIGGEYLFQSHWSAGADAAYIFSGEYFRKSRHTRGMIFRPFIRYYPGNRNFFWQGELHYKSATYQILDWIDRDVVNGLPTYQEYTAFNYIKKVYDFHVIAGRRHNLSKNEKLKLESYFGLGYRWKDQGLDKGEYNPPNSFFADLYDPAFNGIVAVGGIRLTYRIIAK